MLLHLICAFEVITSPNKRVITLFHHFFLQFRHIVEIDQKRITPQLQDPLSRAFYKYWQLLICILVDLEWVYQSITSKRSDKEWLRFQEGGGGGRYVSRNDLTIGGLNVHPSCMNPLETVPCDILFHVRSYQ